jgi:hypothetical protein
MIDLPAAADAVEDLGLFVYPVWLNLNRRDQSRLENDDFAVEVAIRERIVHAHQTGHCDPQSVQNSGIVDPIPIFAPEPVHPPHNWPGSCGSATQHWCGDPDYAYYRLVVVAGARGSRR